MKPTPFISSWRRIKCFIGSLVLFLPVLAHAGTGGDGQITFKEWILTEITASGDPFYSSTTAHRNNPTSAIKYGDFPDFTATAATDSGTVPHVFAQSPWYDAVSVNPNDGNFAQIEGYLSLPCYTTLQIRTLANGNPAATGTVRENFTALHLSILPSGDATLLPADLKRVSYDKVNFSGTRVSSLEYTLPNTLASGKWVRFGDAISDGADFYGAILQWNINGAGWVNIPASAFSSVLGGTGSLVNTPGQCVCGNGLVEPGEACDDANTVSGDGCAAACTIESGFTCQMTVVGEGPTVCAEDCVVCHDVSGAYSFNGANFVDTKSKLTNPANFGPNGTVKANMIFKPLPTNGTITEALLDTMGCDVVHLGLGSNTIAASTTAIPITHAESIQVRNWSLKPKHFAIVNQGFVADWGYTNVAGNTNPNTLQPEFTSLSAGPFGSVASFVQSGGFQGSVSGGPPLLNCEVTLDSAGRSSIVYDSTTGDFLMGDVDIISDLSLSAGATITNSNDILLANMFAFACKNDTTVPAGCPVPNSCGNGMVEGTEACDDGNTAAGDGCSATCTVESGYVCSPTTVGSGPSIWRHRFR